jgi:PAS domain S-box-containing protein
MQSSKAVEDSVSARSYAGARRRAAERGRPRGPGREQRHLALALVVAVAAPAAITTIQFAEDVRPILPGLLYVLAVAVATVLGGVVPGFVAGALSIVLLDYFFLGDERGFEPWTLEDAVAILTFVAVAVGLGRIITQLGHAREIAELARSAESEARVASEEAAARIVWLQQATAALAEAVTAQEVLDAIIAKGVVASEARAGVIGLLAPDGETIEIVASHGYEPEVLAGWEHFPLNGPYPFSEVVRTGTPLFFRTSEELAERFPELAIQMSPSHGFTALPIPIGGRPGGALGLSFPGISDPSPEQRGTEIALARMAGQALERARLFEAEQQLLVRLGFLAEASSLLASSLDYGETLTRLADLVVPDLADWCAIDILGPDGSVERLAVAHQDPAKREWARELQERYPPDPDAPFGVPKVLRTGEPDFLPEIPNELLEAAAEGDTEMLEIIRELGLRSSMIVPLIARERTLGALTLIAAESGRIYDESDFKLAQDVARRAAVAVDNARLYDESARRAEAARALAYTADGVILIDDEGVVRFWNPAAAAITGRSEEEALGRPVSDVVPAWEAVSAQVELGGPQDSPARSARMPFRSPDGERWVSISAVDFGEGCVYALRDVTEEEAFERQRSDFVSTASHELRTPLAAVYGAARTLRRAELELDEADRSAFLDMIESEAERLARIVNQILLAGQLDAGEIEAEGRCDPVPVVESVLESAAVRSPESVSLAFDPPESFPELACDESRFRQVLVNLVENAIKYSPDGGDVTVALAEDSGQGRVEVSDRGLGVPQAERERIFEKFYRLDPALRRGVGGTGLGLYISRELVERMHGRVWTEPRAGGGSTFVVELPLFRG